MITNNINVNSLINSYLNANRNDTNVNKSSVNQTNYSEDSYTPSTKFATSLGVYSKDELNEEDSISQEEFDEYCAYLYDDGKIVQYIPPRNAPLSVKKAWIEAAKKLTIDEKVQAQSAIEMECRRKYHLEGGLSPATVESYMAGMTSYQELFSGAIKHAKDLMASGIGDKERHQKNIDVLEDMLDIFKKNGVK